MSERVKVTCLGKVRDICVSNWPNGVFLAGAIDSLVAGSELPVTPRDSVGSPSVDPPSYWQACARWALLYKFGGTTRHPRYIITAVPKKRHVLQMEEEDCCRIGEEWSTVMDRQPSSSTAELVDFLSSSCSNGKVLEWATMRCQPGCQFRLHSHPNLELVYCVSGALFEIRQKDNGAWCFGTLNAGQWLVNEIDSIHKSFTATNGTGCILLVLWSGSHENLDELKHVQEAVNNADKKLNGCQDCFDWNVVKETFLPKSEKTTEKHLR